MTSSNPPPPVTKVNGLQLQQPDVTSRQKDAINMALVAAAHYNRVEILKHLLSLGAHVDFVAEMEITQLYDEPEADNVFFDLTGNKKSRTYGTSVPTHIC